MNPSIGIPVLALFGAKKIAESPNVMTKIASFLYKAPA
jgi:hypothetical protein